MGEGAVQANKATAAAVRCSCMLLHSDPQPVSRQDGIMLQLELESHQ